jgi:hypothetical protein
MYDLSTSNPSVRLINDGGTKADEKVSSIFYSSYGYEYYDIAGQVD